MKATETDALPPGFQPVRRDDPNSRKMPLHSPDAQPPSRGRRIEDARPLNARADMPQQEGWGEEESTSGLPPVLAAQRTAPVMPPRPQPPGVSTQEPPRLSQAPAAVARAAEPQAEEEDEGEQAPPRLIVEGSRGPEWERVELPSLHLFYPQERGPIQLRQFSIMTLAKIHKANVTGEFTLLVDALDDCIDGDIRDLTAPDFYFVMYWMRINSYPSSPFTIDWKSRYGNDNSLSVSRTSLDIKTPEITREEVEYWRAQGIVPPTVRDMELIQNSRFDSAENWVFERAQFLVGKTYEEKKARLIHGGIALAEKIRDFRAKIDHGVKEVAKVRDAKFNPEAAIAHLEEQSRLLRQVIAEMIGQGDVTPYLQAASDYEGEIEEMKAIIKDGGTPVAREEEVALTINATKFFPGI